MVTATCPTLAPARATRRSGRRGAIVDISAALAADLTALTLALDDPAVDLESRLRALAADGNDTAMAETSLTIALSALTTAQDGSSLLIYPWVYPWVPGAFVDLAVDLSYVLDIDPAFLVLDKRRRSAATRDGSGVAGADEFSLINPSHRRPDGSRPHSRKRARRVASPRQTRRWAPAFRGRRGSLLSRRTRGHR